MLDDPRVRFFYYFTTATCCINVVAEQRGSSDLLLAFYIYELLARLCILLLLAYQQRLFTTAKYGLWTRIAISLPLLVPVVVTLYRMPFVWESQLWTAQMDTVLAVAILFDGDSASRDHICRTIQEMFATFYFASGVWKINADFLDPTVSCATMFLVQTMAQYVATFDPLPLLRFLLPVTPWAIVLVELGMGVTLWWACYRRSRSSVGVALLLVLGFHLAVCLTPRPNDVSVFGVKCAARLVVILPASSLRRVEKECWKQLQRHCPWLLPLMAIVVAWGYQQTTWTINNWGLAFFVPIMATELCAASMPFATKDDTRERQNTRPHWMLLGILMAVFYSFVPLTLGCMDEGMPNMFANLKLHGGSNHWFLPTGLLLSANVDPYSGGIIRIEATTSTWLRSIHPSDLTDHLQPVGVVQQLLADLLTPSLRTFHGSKNRILRLYERQVFPDLPPFTPYTVPAIELKRIFREALERDVAFTLTMAVLDGIQGDERWRATSTHTRYRVRVRHGTLLDCRVQHGSSARPCSPDDLPYQLEVPWWARKLGSFHGVPLLVDADGHPRDRIACFGC